MDLDLYYIFLNDISRDRMDRWVVVEKDIFDQFLQHEKALMCGWDHEIPKSISDLQQTLYDLPDADLRKSEIKLIPTDHIITILTGY